jgi:hypothetical protein
MWVDIKNIQVDKHERLRGDAIFDAKIEGKDVILITSWFLEKEYTPESVESEFKDAKKLL